MATVNTLVTQKVEEIFKLGRFNLKPPAKNKYKRTTKALRVRVKDAIARIILCSVGLSFVPLKHAPFTKLFIPCLACRWHHKI